MSLIIPLQIIPLTIPFHLINFFELQYGVPILIFHDFSECLLAFYFSIDTPLITQVHILNVL